MSPRFSVIIPAFNAAATLSRAIESVQAQSWPAHEIIVVDDGSTDATADIAAGFGDAVRLLRQQNCGVSMARNAGGAAAGPVGRGSIARAAAAASGAGRIAGEVWEE